MNRDLRVESLLERLLTETPVSRASDQLRADIASATSRKRQRPPWLTSLKEPPMRFRSQLVVGSPTLRVAAVLTVATALLVALAGVVVLGASPEPVGPNPPTWVTGDVQPASSCSEPPPVADGDVRRSRDVECSPQTWTSSDPRLTAEVSRRWNWDTYQTDEGSISVDMDAAYLRNDGGGWACSSSYLVKGPSVTYTGTATFTCIGDGGYAGLSAILVLVDVGGNAEEFVGLIFSGDFPPLPEAPAAQ